MDKIQTHSLFLSIGDCSKNIRQWLDAAPFEVAAAGMHTWGELLACIVCNIGQGIEEDAGDAIRIGQYFDAMASLLPSQWWWKGPGGQESGCAHDSFHRICRTLVPTEPKVSHFLDALVREQKWAPGNLLDALEKVQRNNLHWVRASDSTSLSILLQGLGTLPTTAWTPRNHPAYGPFWLAPTIDFFDATSQVKELAKDNPALTPYMLLALYRANQVPHYHMEKFFPLAMDPCDENKLAHALLLWMTETTQERRADRSIVFEHLLMDLHPHVAQLLGMHLNLFPDASAQCTYSDILAPGLGALFGRKANNDEDIFSDAFASLVWDAY